MKFSHVFRVSTLLVIALTCIQMSFASTEVRTCAEFLEKRTELEAIGDRAKFLNKFKNPWDEAVAAASAYGKMPAWVKNYINEEQVTSLLQEPEMSLFITHLKSVFVKLKRIAPSVKTTASQKKLLRDLFRELPLNSIEKVIGRGELLEKYLFEEPNLLGALGFRDLKQMQDLLYGSALSNPKENSLLGYYIKKTEAAHTLTAFSKGPRRERGEKRLAVAVSNRSMKLFKELFTLPEFFYHVHYPEQGTLLVSHMGHTGSYARMEDDLRRPSLGSLMPMILLNSSESNRLRNFFQLSKIDRNVTDQNGNPIMMNDGSSCARHPWELDGYCAAGGYTCCTHWVGNIPIGDKKVNAYIFPGNADEHAGNAKGPGPQKQKLGDYEYPNPLMKLVWQAPGHEQLADVLGAHGANMRGEFANPGWVLHTLIGRVSRDRVPVVFLMVGNHKEKIETPINEQSSPY